ncbi:MAG TPA: VOC family protein [Gemmatimonadales bacterium]
MTDHTQHAGARPLRQKPESLRFRTISPALTVADFRASVAWYTEVLGLVVDETWQHEGEELGAMFKAGDTHLMIVQGNTEGQGKVKGEGLRLYCSTAQDIDELAANITARGGTLATQPRDMPWGTRSFSVEDPDGYKLTISSLK